LPASLCFISIEVIVTNAFFVFRRLIRILTVRQLQERPKTKRSYLFSWKILWPDDCNRVRMFPLSCAVLVILIALCFPTESAICDRRFGLL